MNNYKQSKYNYSHLFHNFIELYNKDNKWHIRIFNCVNGSSSTDLLEHLIFNELKSADKYYNFIRWGK